MIAQIKDELKDEIKNELRKELSEKIDDQIEEEIEEELEEDLKRGREVFSRSKSLFIAIAAAVMTLGQYSEAIALLEDGMNSLLSRFTHTVEYDLLSKIHVNNTELYVENLLGYPQVSREIDKQIVAKYFYKEKYLLTLFVKKSTVIGYTLIPLEGSFKPSIISDNRVDWALQDATFDQFPANPKMYMVDHSKTASYYLEMLDSGRAGLFINIYLGSVSLLGTNNETFLVDLYKQDVSGSDAKALEAQTSLRQFTRPNLYGEGTLDLDMIQKSILTAAEFSRFFGS